MQALALFLLATGAPAGAADAAPAVMPVVAVQAPVAVRPVPSEYRLRPITVQVRSALRIDDPASPLRSGFGGSLVDLFPFHGGAFHVSGGGRLFGRAGRPRVSGDPESMRYLPAFRAGGPRMNRRFSPAMLVGYGHTVERGLALGVDAGMVMGRIGATPDRFGQLNRRRLSSVDGRGSKRPTNELARMTLLYRF